MFSQGHRSVIIALCDPRGKGGANLVLMFIDPIIKPKIRFGNRSFITRPDLIEIIDSLNICLLLDQPDKRFRKMDQVFHEDICKLEIERTKQNIEKLLRCSDSNIFNVGYSE